MTPEDREKQIDRLITLLPVLEELSTALHARRENRKAITWAVASSAGVLGLWLSISEPAKDFIAYIARDPAAINKNEE